MAAGEPVLREHTMVHISLRPFSPLMAWLKRNDESIYNFIKDNYLGAFNCVCVDGINLLGKK